MASGILGTAVSGLIAVQRQLATTGHNISNVNTEGFSRQRVLFSSRGGQGTGAGFIGQGVDAVRTERIYDQFLVAQVRSSTSAFSELDTFRSLAVQVDNFIADPNLNLSSSLQAFFGAVHEVADDPSSIPARQVLLAHANTLADQFVTVDNRLDNLSSQVNRNIESSVSEINSIAESIARINEDIVIASGQSGGSAPNDLLDQRDHLLTQLSEYVDVTAVEQDDGSLSVFIGNGQPLVLGINSAALATQRSDLDPERLDILYTANSSSVVITQNLSGGELSGSLKFAEEILGPTRKGLGRVALGLTADFNDIHGNGFDLDGNTQQLFFDPPQVTVIGNTSNTGTIAVSFDDVNQVSLSDYSLTFDGTNYSLIRLSDNVEVYNDSVSNFTIDGFAVDAVAAVSGDSFLIRPTHNIAGEISVAISDTNQIAASQSNTITGSVGDNRNALALAALETNQNLLNGTATFQEAYGKAVANVGTLTRAADINSQAQEGLLIQAQQAQQAVSGVNLDEEAANLVRFQQAYQASAQLVSVANEIFDSLLNATRR